MIVARSQDGFAVIVAMMAMLLMSALGAALVLSTSIETQIARNFADATTAIHVADAAATHVALELAAVDDWTLVLAGVTRSRVVDGEPGGARTLADGSTIHLTEILNLSNCGSVLPCPDSELAAITEARPWGANNPRWRLFAWGRFADLLPDGAADSEFYVAALVADDPAESDGDPLVDGGGPGNPGTGLVMVRAEAFGRGGAHAAVELTLGRALPTDLARNPQLLGIRPVSWRAGR
jgi:hypothetical protein